MADITNVGPNYGNTKASLASEYTLNELLMAFKATSGLSEKQLKKFEELNKNFKKKDPRDPTSDVGKRFGRVGDAAAKLEESLHGLPKQFELFDDFLTRGAQKPVEALGGQLKGLGDTVATVANSKWLKWFGGGLLGTAVGMVGTSFGILAGYMQNSLDTFRDLSTYGGNFGNSLIELRKAALLGNLSLEEFSSLVKQNSQLFATIGYNVSDGARVFSKLSLDVRKFDNYRLKELGFTVEDVNDMLADYLDIASKTTDIQGQLNNNQGKVVESAVKFGTELNSMSALTGINRKQLAKEIKEVSERGEVQAALLMAQRRGVKDVDDRFRSLILAVAPFGKSAINAAADLTSFGGAFRTQESRSLLIAAPQFARKLRAYTQAVTSNAPPSEVGEAYGDMVKSLLSSEDRLIAMARAGNKDAARILSENAAVMSRYRGLSEEEIDAKIAMDAKDAAARAKAGQSLAKLDEVFRNIQSKIQTTIINSKVFEKMVAGLDIISNWFASSDFEYYLNEFIGYLEKGLHYLANIFTPEGRTIILKDVSNMFESILLELRKVLVKSSFYRWLTGDSGEDIAFREKAVESEKSANIARQHVETLGREKILLEKQLDDLQKIPPEKRGVDWYEKFGQVSRELNMARNNLSGWSDTLEREKKSAEESWKQAKGTDLATKVQNQWDDFLAAMVRIKDYAFNLFSDEGRQEIYKKASAVFEGLFLDLRQILQSSWLFRKLVSEDKTYAVDRRQFDIGKEIDTLTEKLKTASAPDDIGPIQERIRLLKEENDLLERMTDQQKKLYADQRKAIDDNNTAIQDSNKKLAQMLRQKGYDDATIGRVLAGVESLPQELLSTRLEGGAAAAAMAAGQPIESKTEIGDIVDSIDRAKETISGVERDQKKLADDVRGKPKKQYGGPVSGGLIWAHDKEFMLSEEMMKSLTSTFNLADLIYKMLDQKETDKPETTERPLPKFDFNQLPSMDPDKIKLLTDLIDDMTKEFTTFNKVNLTIPRVEDESEKIDFGKISIDPEKIENIFPDRSSLFTPTRPEEPKPVVADKEETNLEERVKSITDYSKPEQEQFKINSDSKLILQDLKDNNEELLNLFRQHLVFQEQLSRDITDLLDLHERNA